MEFNLGFKGLNTRPYLDMMVKVLIPVGI